MKNLRRIKRVVTQHTKGLMSPEDKNALDSVIAGDLTTISGTTLTYINGTFDVLSATVANIATVTTDPLSIGQLSATISMTATLGNFLQLSSSRHSSTYSTITDFFGTNISGGLGHFLELSATSGRIRNLHIRDDIFITGTLSATVANIALFQSTDLSSTIGKFAYLSSSENRILSSLYFGTTNTYNIDNAGNADLLSADIGSIRISSDTIRNVIELTSSNISSSNTTFSLMSGSTITGTTAHFNYLSSSKHTSSYSTISLLSGSTITGTDGKYHHLSSTNARIFSALYFGNNNTYQIDEQGNADFSTVDVGAIRLLASSAKISGVEQLTASNITSSEAGHFNHLSSSKHTSSYSTIELLSGSTITGTNGQFLFLTSSRIFSGEAKINSLTSSYSLISTQLTAEDVAITNSLIVNQDVTVDVSLSSTAGLFTFLTSSAQSSSYSTISLLSGSTITGTVGQFLFLSATNHNIVATVSDPLIINTLTASVYMSGNNSTFTRLTASNLSASTAHFNHLSSSKHTSSYSTIELLSGSTISGSDGKFNFLTASRFSSSISAILNLSSTILNSTNANFSTLSATIITSPSINISTLSSTLATLGVLSSSNISASTGHFNHLSSSKHTSSYSTITLLSGSTITGTNGQFLFISGTRFTASHSQIASLQVTNSLISDIDIETPGIKNLAGPLSLNANLGLDPINFTGNGFTFTGGSLDLNNNSINEVASISGTTGNFNHLSSSKQTSSYSTIELLSGSIITGTVGQFLFLSATNHNITAATSDPLIINTLTASVYMSGNNSTFTTLTASSLSSSAGHFTLLSGSTITGTVGKYSYLSGANITSLVLTATSGCNFGGLTTVASLRGSTLSGSSIEALNLTATAGTYTQLSSSNLTSSTGHFNYLSSSKHTSSYSTITLLSGSTITGTVGQFTTLSAARGDMISFTSSYIKATNLLTINEIQGGLFSVFGNLGTLSCSTVNSNHLSSSKHTSSYSTITLLSGSTISGSDGKYEFLSASILSATNAYIGPGDLNAVTIRGTTLYTENIIHPAAPGTISLTDTSLLLDGGNIDAANIVSSFLTATNASSTSLTGTNLISTSLTGTSLTSSTGHFNHLSSSKHTSSYSTITLLSGSTITGTVGKYQELSASVFTGTNAFIGILSASELYVDSTDYFVYNFYAAVVPQLTTKVSSGFVLTNQGTVSSADSNERPAHNHSGSSSGSANGLITTSGYKGAWFPDFTVVAGTGVNSTDIQDITYWVALANSSLLTVDVPSSQHVAGFRYTTNISGDTASGSWQCVVCDGSTVLSATTNVTVLSSTYYKFRINYDGTTYRFYINNLFKVAFTSSIPNDSQNLILQWRATGHAWGKNARFSRWNLRLNGSGL